MHRGIETVFETGIVAFKCSCSDRTSLRVPVTRGFLQSTSFEQADVFLKGRHQCAAVSISFFVLVSYETLEIRTSMSAFVDTYLAHTKSPTKS